jgi:hypothetical protein
VNNAPAAAEPVVTSMTGPIWFTHLEAPSVVSKTFSVGEDGQLIKKTAPVPRVGLLTVCGVQTLEELEVYLSQLSPFDCLIWGTPKGMEVGDKVALRTKSRKKAGGIPRDREHFEFRTGKPAVLMLDYDPEEGRPAETITQVYANLVQLHPVFKEVKLLAKHSVGGGIYRGEELLREPRGIRFYAVVNDGAMIPAIQKSLLSLAWARGSGRWQVSRAGTLLSRGLFDTSVGQPERIDFCGGAYCETPLQQKLPPATIINPTGGILDGGQLLLTPEIATTARTAMEASRPEAEHRASPVRAGFKERLYQRLKASGVSDDRVEAALAGLYKEQIELSPEYPLTLDDGAVVTVRNLLDQPRVYNGRHMHDPFEPDYRDDNRIAVALLEGPEKKIYSHAHGGITYLLTRKKVSVRIVVNGDRAVISDVARVMTERRALFRRGESIVTVDHEGIVSLTPSAVVAVLSDHIKPTKLDNQGTERCVSFPRELATAWIDLRGEGLPHLEGVISAPVMLADGRIIQRIGYDQESGLFLVGSNESVEPVPDAPMKKDVQDALTLLWEPFAEFPLASENDRAGLLALILTAFTRTAYPTAPAGLITAPAAGHGKTLLGMALAHLAGGENVAVAPPVLGSNSEEEMRKRLFAIARGGKAAVVYDNLEPGPLVSPGLCAFLTSGEIEDRILGASKVESVPFRSFFLLTGNNVSPEGDLPRRTVICRIDAGVENAFQGRAFKVNPLEHCLDNRQAMARAALIVLRAYWQAGCPRFGTPFGSFEGWDKMVRQPVLWIREKGLFHQAIGDPIAASLEAASKGNVEEVLKCFLRWYRARFSNDHQTAQDIGNSLVMTPEAKDLQDSGSPASIREELRVSALEGLLELRVAHRTKDGLPEVKPSKLGHFLKAHRGRVVDGQRIEKSAVDDRTGRSCWGVTVV